jgi:hypothetical protein
MVLGCRATTELSSFTASSTTSLLGLFLRSRMAVLKSFLSTAFFLHRPGPGHAQLPAPALERALARPAPTHPSGAAEPLG